MRSTVPPAPCTGLLARLRRSGWLLGTAALLAGCGSSGGEEPAQREAEVAGPVAGAFSLATIGGIDFGDLGYESAEFFLSGDAVSYAADGPVEDDGAWRADEDAEAPYRTRVVVIRPSDPADFSGTTFVEWLNVSAGFDTSPDWQLAHVELLRRGHAWVGVSAQRVGIEGSGGGGLPLYLKAVDPARYGDLSHPGDEFSYDIFTQAGRAVREEGPGALLGGLEPDVLIAMGESQSAGRMVTYVNAVDPLEATYDAFFVHSRGGGAAALTEPVSDAPRIRDDVRVPVLDLQTQSDVIGLGSIRARQPDTERFRLWEVAGASHADLYTLRHAFADIGQSIVPARVDYVASPIPGIVECDEPVNANPAHHYAVKAAVRALDTWVRQDVAPPSAPRIATVGDPAQYDLDTAGNVRGGIRSPWVDAPTAVFGGIGAGSSFCFLFGTSVPLSPAQLADRYASQDDYEAQALAALDASVAAGFLLADDAPIVTQAIEASDLGLLPRADVTGPVAGDDFFAISTAFDLASVDYEREEFVLEGTARSFRNVGPLEDDGRWTAEPAEEAAYRTRLFVYRPADPADFSGTVVVEWLNVTIGSDTAVDWQFHHTEVLRRGHAYVGVSAQKVGVDNLQGRGGRYAGLVHPGDSFSYDIFSQAGQALRRPGAVDPLAGLAPEVFLASGESQSASRMVTYVNAVDPLVHVFDGFLIHSRGDGSSSLSQDPQPPVPTPAAPRIREDARVPVLTVQSQTDVVGLDSFRSRQADSDRFRLWEIPGSAHVDAYSLQAGQQDVGQSIEVAKLQLATFPGCSTPMNGGPQHHYVLKAALRGLETWVRDGTPPASAPRMEVDAAAPAYRLDALGNVRGGIRTPWVDAPTARLGGVGSGAFLCFLSGSTEPFDLTTLASLYASDADYRAQALDALDAAVAAGFLLADDAGTIEAAIEDTTLGLDVPAPAVSGPIPGTPFLPTTTFDLATVGYEQAEYFVEGTARSYASDAALADDGAWSVVPGETAPYRTRLLVYRPSDPADFSGSVFVEWLNVSGGLDAAPDWTAAHVELIRRGHVWVGVSAQFVGVEGGGGIIPGVSLHLKVADPARYGELSHPGDSFSYDLFAQAARALRTPASVDPLDGLAPEHVYAMGQSQSATRLVTYVNAVAPVARVYDGFLVHGRLGGAAPLSQDPQVELPTGPGPRIREDTAVPVLTVQTETDVTGLSSYLARQPDTDRIRTWEIAGTAHADTYTLTLGNEDVGDSIEAAQLLIVSAPLPGILECDAPINSAPQHHYVVMTGVRALDGWVRDGTPPPVAEPLVLDEAPIRVAEDALGNGLGGIRTPWVDAPTALLRGDGQTGLCFLFGRTELFAPATIDSLYADQSDYVEQALGSLEDAVAAGFLLEDDAAIIEAAVRARATELGLDP